MNTAVLPESSTIPQTSKLDAIYFRVAPTLTLISAALLPVRLNLSYLFLIPLNVLWLLRFLSSRHRSQAIIIPQSQKVFFAFVVSCLVSSFFGIDPGRSAVALGRLLFYSVTVGVIGELCALGRLHVRAILLALICGQVVAALHTVLSGAGFAMRDLLTGPVSESGQLALTIVATVGLLLAINEEAISEIKRQPSPISARSRYRYLRNGATLFGVCLTFIYTSSNSVDLGAPTPFPLAISQALVIALPLFVGAMLLWWLRRDPPPGRAILIGVLLLALPLMVSALIANLKRGPWFGVLVGISILVLCYARRYLLHVVIGAVLIFSLVPPVRDRLARSVDHFFIVGGRNELWDIGLELATRYPLGIGYENSRFLQRFSHDIPPELTHFHNNFLNILVETGWCSMALFLVWLGSLLYEAFSNRPNRAEILFATGIGCAVISWQIAGLVEYNVGDSEVLIIAFMLSAALVRKGPVLASNGVA